MKYFAYGSNMLNERLRARVKSAANPRRVTVQGYNLCFSKRSSDGSGKCAIIKTGSANDVVHGVVFDVEDAEIGKLDRAEGVGYGYTRDDTFMLNVDEVSQQVTVYLAESSYIDNALRPYRWYRDLVLAGAEQHSLPQDYVARLAAVAFDEDGWKSRPERLKALATLKAYADGRIVPNA